MPWEDVERCCRAAVENSDELKQLRQSLKLPHSEELLADLVNVHIVAGNKDLADHISGIKMKADNVARLIDILRSTGYSGYEDNGVNSKKAVEERLRKQYREKYGEGLFIPEAVQKSIEAGVDKKRKGASLIWDKGATPAEPAASVAQLDATLRPMQILCERTGGSISEAHNEYGQVFEKFCPH